MKNKLMKNILILSVITFSFNAMAEQPKEKIELNNTYEQKGKSISVQGVANKILEVAGKTKYLVINRNNIEYAYTIRKLGSGDMKYHGNQNDIDGLVFLEVIGYKEGRELNNQLTTYRPSKFKDAIYLEKFDRNENRPYQFNLSIDSKGNIFMINDLNDVTYLEQKDTLKKPKTLLEEGRKFVF